MKLSTWTATVLATPAVATGVCLLCASTAQAAPDDAGSETSSAAVSSASDSTTASSDHDATSAADTENGGSSVDTVDAENADDLGDVDDLDDSDAPRDDLDVDLADSGLADSDAIGSEAVDDAGDDLAETDLDVTPGGTAPHYVPTTVRATLVAGDAIDIDGDGVDDAAVVGDEDGADEPVDTVPVALEQISDAKEDLREATWDSGNLFAGLAAMLPQMYLSGASASLERWQQNHALLQQRYAETDGDTFAHWLAGIGIENSIQRTIRAQNQLDAAERLLTVVGWFGPRAEMEAIGQLIGAAADNGLVYQILDLDMEDVKGVRRVNPIFAMSINGGDPVRVLLDTGSYGLIINPQVIGLENLGAPTGHGTGCYADCSTPYNYDVYNIPIAVDDDVVSTRTPVLVVTLDTWYALSETNTNYEGVLGIGWNSGGPGNSTPLGALPGLLSQGILMQQSRNRAILGPNPYAARVTLGGAPVNNLMVKVGDSAEIIETWIDSGGLTGSIPASLAGGDDSVPDGTLISVYTPDGETLLFSYRTSGRNTPVVDDEEFVLVGFQAFAKDGIYTDFVTGEMAFNYR